MFLVHVSYFTTYWTVPICWGVTPGQDPFCKSEIPLTLTIIAGDFSYYLGNKWDCDLSSTFCTLSSIPAFLRKTNSLQGSYKNSSSKNCVILLINALTKIQMDLSIKPYLKHGNTVMSSEGHTEQRFRALTDSGIDFWN